MTITESKAYECYKKAVGGKTWEGKDMLPFMSMPQNIRDAWSSIDLMYCKPKKERVKKPEEPIVYSKAYDEYKIKHKNAKDFDCLDTKFRKMWNTIDKNQEKFLAPKPEKKVENKTQKTQSKQ